MADDTMNEGSDEEKKSNQPDEDFGLPDLEFDELQELDFNLDDDDDETPSNESETEESGLSEPEGIDMSVLDDMGLPESDGLQPGDLDPPESTALEQGIDEVEDVLDSAQLISDRLGDDETESDDGLSPDFGADINYDDLMGGTDDDTTSDIFSEDSSMLDDIGLDVSEAAPTEQSDDLLANIDSPDQLAALGILDEEEDTGISDSPSEDFGSSLFSDDTGSTGEDSIFASDSMSMQIEEPVESDTTPPELPAGYKPYSYEESSGGFAKIVLIGVVLATIIAGVFYYMSLDETDKQVAKKEVPVKKVTKKAVKPNAAEAAKKKKAAEERQQPIKQPLIKQPLKKRNLTH
jgi:hypothetical protein